MSLELELFPVKNKWTTVQEIKLNLLKLGLQCTENLSFERMSDHGILSNESEFELNEDYVITINATEKLYISFMENEPVFNEFEVLSGYNFGKLEDNVLHTISQEWSNCGFTVNLELKAANSKQNHQLLMGIAIAFAEQTDAFTCLKNDQLGQPGLYDLSELVELFHNERN